MKVHDVVLGLAAGVGIDLSPDGKTAYFVEWSVGELSRVDVRNGAVAKVSDGLEFPQDVEVDWASGEIFVSQRTGAIVRVHSNGESRTVVKPGGAPHQLALIKSGRKRFLYTVCYESGKLLRIDLGTRRTTTIATGLGHPVGLVVDAAQKYAYVTEQDKGSLTRVDLARGTSRPLYTRLVSPFFLAWTENAKGIYCVQRDPANSLVRLNLGRPVTVTTIAHGLAFRPSGVAPNADDTLIYTCSDRELEVITFNGGPTIKLPKRPFDIHSIQFLTDQGDAIELKNHLTGQPIALPEYVKGTRNEASAYVGGSLPKIQVVLRKRAGYSSGTYAIGATGSLGGVRRRVVKPRFKTSGLSHPIDFEFMWRLHDAVGRPDVTLDWYARKTPGAAVPGPIGSAIHRLYVLIGKPTQPWVTETPWVDALELSCGWAAGATTADEAAGRITERYYNCGQVSYDTISGSTAYGGTYFNLTEMLERLNGGLGLGEKVNCTDSANTVSTLANLIGCDLWQSRMGWSFKLNPILAIGYPPPDPMPNWNGFSYHEVAWKGNCTENENLFDGCLCVDGDADPSTAPHAWLLPKDMRFGDCSTMNYRLRLSPAVPGGCAQCQAATGTRQRRPLV